MERTQSRIGHYLTLNSMAITITALKFGKKKIGKCQKYYFRYENGYEQGMKGDYRICDGFPHNEDPNCSNQYEFSNAAAMALYGHQHRLGST